MYLEKTRLKKLMKIIIIMNKLEEPTVFGECQKLTSAMKQRPENLQILCSIEVVFIESLLKSGLSKKVNRKFV